MARSLRAVLLLASFALGSRLVATPFENAQELYRAKRYAEARTAFETVAAAEPDNAAAAYHLGQLALMRSDATEAARWLQKATALAPTSARYVRALGDAYGLSIQKAGLFSKLGLARKCLAAYEKAVELDPDDVNARYALLNFYRQAPGFAGGGLDKARAEAREIQKRDDVRGTVALADISAAEKKFDEAFAVLDSLRQRHPGSPDAAYAIGRAAASSGQRLEEGAAMLTEYLAHTPDDKQPPLWAAHWRLGQIFEKKGDPAGARAEYQAALKLNPIQPQLLEALQRVK
jgi:tetratricopeptide (TPR) repeat protein